MGGRFEKWKETHDIHGFSVRQMEQIRSGLEHGLTDASVSGTDTPVCHKQVII